MNRWERIYNSSTYQGMIAQKTRFIVASTIFFVIFYLYSSFRGFYLFAPVFVFGLGAVGPSPFLYLPLLGFCLLCPLPDRLDSPLRYLGPLVPTG